MVEFYRASPSPNKGSLSHYTSQVRGFLLCYPLLPLRNIYTFKFTLLAVLSYVAMIGAIPLGKRDPPPTLDCSSDPDLWICKGPNCIDPDPPICSSPDCSSNPDLPICSGFCANNINFALPVCSVCINDSEPLICEGVCKNFSYLPSCQSSPAPSD
ncbi:hypothetical protein F5888DRAFT_1806025 [Russula emetica]|nr:hypothetical protein F5888DRAFT_1807978 [Russula emetica]KAF8493705.1 hypothetical protein F5888DRAFT_1806025 [Russula emetica]